LVVSFFGNFAGALAVVKMIELSGLVGAENAAMAGVATAKCSIPFGKAFIRGIFCNWMVCIALWQQVSKSIRLFNQKTF
jgi:formate/nitrite transporter FocA (FNT family)